MHFFLYPLYTIPNSPEYNSFHECINTIIIRSYLLQLSSLMSNKMQGWSVTLGGLSSELIDGAFPQLQLSDDYIISVRKILTTYYFHIQSLHRCTGKYGVHYISWHWIQTKLLTLTEVHPFVMLPFFCICRETEWVTLTLVKSTEEQQQCRG